jgi:hypothetical protein
MRLRLSGGHATAARAGCSQPVPYCSRRIICTRGPSSNEKAGLPGVILQLLAKVSNVEPEVVSAVGEVVPPNALKEEFLTAWAAGMLCESTEELELGGCQIDASPVLLDLPALQVKRDIAGADQAVFCLLGRPPQDCGESGRKQRWRDRLREVANSTLSR